MSEGSEAKLDGNTGCDGQAGTDGDGEAGLPKVKSDKELQKEKKRLEKLAKFEAKKQKKAEEDAQKKTKVDSEVCYLESNVTDFTVLHTSLHVNLYPACRVFFVFSPNWK